MLQLSLRGHSLSPAYLLRVALPKITPHLEYGSQYWASKLTQAQASKLCSFKDTTVCHMLRLHTRYTAPPFPINYYPASNVVLYMDICYPPTTYKHHYLVIKKFSSIKADCGDILDHHQVTGPINTNLMGLGPLPARIII
jgi:hypothetical protein